MIRIGTQKGDEANAEDPGLKINPKVIERLKPSSDDWFEKLTEAVNERLKKIRSSYGLYFESGSQIF